MTSPDGAGIPDKEDVGGWPGDGGPLSILAKIGEQVILWPLSRFLGAILGEPPQNFDTLPELFSNLIPALIRLPIRIIVGLLGNIPIIGDGIEAAFSNWLKTTSANAAAANITANAALALANATHAGGTSNAVTFEGSGPLDPALWSVSNAARMRRVSGALGIVNQTDDAMYTDWAVFRNAYESDKQMVAAVMDGGGSTSIDTGIMLRCNSDCTRFVYLNIYSSKIYLGQGSRSGSSWKFNDWTSMDITVNDGYSVSVQANGNLYTVTVNGQQVLSYPDTAQTAPVGEAYRCAGARVMQSRIFWTTTRSFHIRSFAMADV